MLEHIYYVTSSLTDSKHVEQELRRMGCHRFVRRNLLSHPTKGVGVGMSHIVTLEIAKQKGVPYVLIVEDDVHFPKVDISTHTETLLQDEVPFDVLMLNATALQSVPDPTRPELLRVRRAESTTAYLVRQHYYDTLITCFKTAILRLQQYPDTYDIYAIDKAWCPLQYRDTWYILRSCC